MFCPSVLSTAGFVRRVLSAGGFVHGDLSVGFFFVGVLSTGGFVHWVSSAEVLSTGCFVRRGFVREGLVR